MKNRKQNLPHTDEIMVVTRREKKNTKNMREDKEGKGDQIQEDRRDETLGGEPIMEYAMLYYKVIQVKFI